MPAFALVTQPASLDELLRLKAHHGAQAKVVVGNTEIGIEQKFRGRSWPVLLSLSSVPEMHELRLDLGGQWHALIWMGMADLYGRRRRPVVHSVLALLWPTPQTSGTL